MKLGMDGGVLKVLGNLSVQATLDGTPVGPVMDSAALVGLLGGTNEGEITFTPHVNYNGVQVTFRSLIALAASVQVYEAYFRKTATGVCSSVPVDYLTGVGALIPNLNLATFAGQVNNRPTRLTEMKTLPPSWKLTLASPPIRRKP